MTKTDGRVSSTWKKMICPRSLDIWFKATQNS
jgi:hypothetical protein